MHRRRAFPLLVVVLALTALPAAAVPLLPPGPWGPVMGVGVEAEGDVDRWTCGWVHPQVPRAMTVSLLVPGAAPGDTLLLGVQSMEGMLWVPTEGTPPVASVRFVHPSTCPGALVAGERVAAAAVYVLTWSAD